MIPRPTIRPAISLLLSVSLAAPILRGQTIEWSDTFGAAPGFDLAAGVAVDPAGAVYVTGTSSVAIKVIKLGMDTREVVARFEAERQALALMNHPGIARIFDAGITDAGRPYFVMEHVDGEALTAYSDRVRLGTRERLALFSEVCDAVEHAHEKSVIHRDLKPSNILVSTEDGTPRPKIIDFGVAKATDQRLTEKSFHTDLGRIVGTPDYMSPEQAALTGVDIDARTDVYSLGVVLYELLAGALPFDPAALRHAGLAELRRTIRETDPTTPSTRLSTLGNSSRTAAERRQTDPRKLRRELRGELDQITMKALEKDRTLRYPTAAALGEDIARYLRGEPVDAAARGVTYKARKLLRRHGARIVTACVVVASVAVLAGVVREILVGETIVPSGDSGAGVPIPSAWVKLSREDTVFGLRLIATPDECQTEPDRKGPPGDERDGRVHRGPYGNWYFVVLDPVVKAAETLEISAVVYDDPAFAQEPEIVRLHYTNRLSTGPEDLSNTFSLHPDTWSLIGSGEWRSHKWVIADAGFRTYMQSAADFRIISKRVFLDRVDVRISPEALVQHRMEKHILAEDPIAQLTAELRADTSLEPSLRDAAIELARRLPLDGLRRKAYSAAIREAASRLDASDVTEAARLLDSCPVEFRTTWEWRHLDLRRRLRERARDGARDENTDPVTRIGRTSDREYYHADAVFDPAGEFVAISSWTPTVDVVSASTGAILHKLYHRGSGAIAWNPDGKVLASGGSDGRIVLWNVQTGKEIRSRHAHTFAVMALSFSHDGDRLVSAGQDLSLRIWDPKDFRLVETIPRIAKFKSWSVALSPDDQLIASQLSERSVGLWRLEDGELLAKLPSQAATPSVVFNADGTRLVCGSRDGRISAWDVSSLELLHTLKLDSAVWSIALSPEEARLVAACHDGTLRLLDTQAWEVVYSFPAQESKAAYSARFSPDGKHIISSLSDGSARMWETEFESLKTLRHTAPVRDLVAHLFDEKIFVDSVVVAIKKNTELAVEQRAFALRIAHAHAASGAATLNAFSWNVVKRRDRTIAEYGKALELARKACKLSPEHASYQNTLGAALYRVGKFREAIPTLHHADRINQQSPGPYGRETDLIILAMYHHRLGEIPEAAFLLHHVRTHVSTQSEVADDFLDKDRVPLSSHLQHVLAPLVELVDRLFEANEEFDAIIAAIQADGSLSGKQHELALRMARTLGE